MLSIVIPLFNEEENIRTLYDRLVSASQHWGLPYEFIFVDDGSWDKTSEKLMGIADADPAVCVVKLSRNFGQQAAISAGLKHAKGDVVSIMDGDLQDPPEELPRFLEKWKEGYHVVYAIRKRRKEGFVKKIIYKSFYRILRFISNIHIPLDSGDFCVMDKRVVQVINSEMIEIQRFVRGLRAYAGFRQIGVISERSERHAGKVKYTWRKLIGLALDGLLDFSSFPLRIATYLGFIIAIPSFLIGFFFIIHRILDFKIFGYSPTDTPGLASLAVGMFFLSGLMMIMIGLIGEYVGRIYIEVKKRPFYIIDEVYQNNDKREID